jgi:predicted DNA-binding transcriptional regulator AlpA
MDINRIDPDSLLREGNAAELLDVKPSTLGAWRSRGTGPEFVRLSARCVRYRRGDLVRWIRARVHRPGPDHQ